MKSLGLSKEADELLQQREALIEMYKAGFLDGCRKNKSVATSKAWKEMNVHYRNAFIKRFEKRVTEELKKQEK